LSGTYPDPTVAQVNGGTVPVLGAVLGSNGSSQLIAANAEQIEKPLACADSSGSPTAQSCSTTPSFSPDANDCIIYTTTTANTGDLTVNVNSLGAAHFRKWLGAATLVAGDMPANRQVVACYDGTDWEVMTIGNAPGALATQGFPAAGIVTSTGSALGSESTVTAGQFPALTGDLTTPGGSLATTLATVNSSPGSCGSASVVCAITTNGKGLVTAQTATTIAIPYSQVSGTPILAQTIAAVSHQWLNSYTSTTGAFTQTQPTLADVAAGATGSGTYDFSAATQLKHPVAAGFVSAANGELGYDSTNLNWHGWANGADEFFAGFSVASPPTSGHLAEFSKSTNSWSLIDGGTIGALASQAFPGSGIVNSTGSAWGASYSTSGTGITLALTAAPTFTGTTTLATVAVTTFSGTPNFSGAATGQTAATADNSTKLATTAYVQAQAAIAAATYAPIASPTFTGTATIPTAAVTTFSGTPNFSGAATSDNSTKLATTAYVQNQGYVTSSSGEATVATANFTGQSANIASTTLFTPTISGLYTIIVYINRSAFCSNVGSGGLSYYLYYTDSRGANNHFASMTFETVFSIGTAISSTYTFWAIGGNPISYAINYTACTSGTAKYDAHVALNTN
jgi:hypothetical protein